MTKIACIRIRRRRPVRAALAFDPT